MIPTILLAFLLVDPLGTGVFTADNSSIPVQSAQISKLTTPNLIIGKVPESLPGMGAIFDQYISVFGVHVLATRGFSKKKMRHVAAMLAEYLDNDEDGKVDNPKVVEAMSSRAMSMILFRNEREMERVERSSVELYGYRYMQGQFAEETNPPGEFDATIEEVLHLVTTGYSEAYPRIFGALPGTALGDCLDRARGGRFGSVPRRYPEQAWFHYDDRTCDYSCMTVEYLYWALTSLLGAQDDPDRVRQIADEWQLATSEQVREKDPWITALLEDPQYHWANRLPDGHYKPAEKAKREPTVDDKGQGR